MSQPDQDPIAPGKQQTEDGPSGISGAFRPFVKELVKAGILAFDTVSEKTSVVTKQFNELLEEARSETLKSPSPGTTEGETNKKGRGSKTGKAKDEKR